MKTECFATKGRRLRESSVHLTALPRWPRCFGSCAAQVMVSMAPEGDQAGSTSLSGNLSRAKEESRTFKSDSDHLQNLGMMIEAMENTIRSDVDGEFLPYLPWGGQTNGQNAHLLKMR